jgi:hypothetical protein
VKVSHSEGRAYRTGPEPCMAIREDRREASAGGRAGQVLSYVTKPVRSADAVRGAEGNTAGCVIASVPSAPCSLRPWHVRKLLAREPGALASGRPATVGPRREGRRAEADDARA